MEGQKEVDEVIGTKTTDADKPPVKNDIYTMPKEFFVPVKVKSKKLLYIIIIVGVLIVVFGGATAYVLITQNKTVGTETPVIPAVTPDESIIEESNAITPVEEEATIINQPDTEVDDTSNIDTTDTSPIVEEEKPVLLPSSVDLDGDGLTDIEEMFLGIDPAVADSDLDGFFDGAEVTAGYDPSLKNANLSDNPIFKAYANDVPSFTVLVPSSWVEKRILAKADTIQFIAPNTDFISFTVETNSDSDAIDVWYTKKYANRTLNELTNRTVGGRVGKESIIRREVYVPIGSFVLIVKYDVAGKKEVAYPGVYEFILNSISF